MRAAISSVAADYDFILIDCPPSLSLLTVNGLCAADSVLIPMQCEYYALEGLSDLVQTLKKVRANLNPRLEIEGLLRTMYDPRNTLAQNVAAELEKHFGDKLYRHGDPAQRAPRRGALARHAGAPSRHDLEGRAGVPRARRRDAAPVEARRLRRPRGGRDGDRGCPTQGDQR